MGKAGIAHFSLCSSTGASAGIWAPDWKIGHGLLYLKVKGQAENAVIEQKMKRVSIFRPGALARDGNTEGGVVSRLDVRVLAAVMVYDAECGDIVDDEKVECEDTLFYSTAAIDGVAEAAVKNFDETCVAMDKMEEKSKEEKKEEQSDEEKKEEQSEKNADAPQEEEVVVNNKDKTDEIVDKPVGNDDADTNVKAEEDPKDEEIVDKIEEVEKEEV